MVGGAAALLAEAPAAAAPADPCCEPLPVSDLPESAALVSDLPESADPLPDLPVSELVEAVPDWVEVDDGDAGVDVEVVEDVPPDVPPLVVALLLREVSVIVNELSRELITATFELLIRVVPSLGTVVVGNGLSLAVVVLAVPVDVEGVVVEELLLDVDVDEELDVDVVPVDVDVVVEVVEVVPAVVVTEKPGTTFRLGVR